MRINKHYARHWLEDRRHGAVLFYLAFLIITTAGSTLWLMPEHGKELFDRSTRDVPTFIALATLGFSILGILKVCLEIMKRLTSSDDNDRLRMLIDAFNDKKSHCKPLLFDLIKNNYGPRLLESIKAERIRTTTIATDFLANQCPSSYLCVIHADKNSLFMNEGETKIWMQYFYKFSCSVDRYWLPTSRLFTFVPDGMTTNQRLVLLYYLLINRSIGVDTWLLKVDKPNDVHSYIFGADYVLTVSPTASLNGDPNNKPPTRKLYVAIPGDEKECLVSVNDDVCSAFELDFYARILDGKSQDDIDTIFTFTKFNFNKIATHLGIAEDAITKSHADFSSRIAKCDDIQDDEKKRLCCTYYKWSNGRTNKPDENACGSCTIGQQ